MMWFRNLLAPEIAQLTREALFYKELYEAERIKSALLEKTVLAERKKRDDLVLKTLDQISRQHGLPMVFKEKVVQPKPEPEPLSMADAERVSYIAEAMRNDDLDRDGDARPIEAYIDAIKLDPARYLS
jgi:hypothetical protein